VAHVFSVLEPLKTATHPVSHCRLPSTYSYEGDSVRRLRQRRLRGDQNSMCGIAGVIDLEHKPIDPGELLRMNESIAHRGPDDEGYVLIDQTTSSFREY